MLGINPFVWMIVIGVALVLVMALGEAILDAFDHVLGGGPDR